MQQTVCYVDYFKGRLVETRESIYCDDPSSTERPTKGGNNGLQSPLRGFFKCIPQEEKFKDSLDRPSQAINHTPAPFTPPKKNTQGAVEMV